MENELARYPDVETGGLLLGYSNADGVDVLEATDAGPNAVRTADTFRMDPAYTAHMSRILSELHTPNLQVVGLWHKHNSVGEIPFSRTDEAAHRQLLALYPHPCLSILYEKEDDEDYDGRVFLLEETGAQEVDSSWQVIL